MKNQDSVPEHAERTQPDPSQAAGGGARAVAIDIALNLVLPYGAYLLLRRQGVSETAALVLGAVIPALVAALSLLHRRRINTLSLLVIGATALSLIATWLSGSAWFALVRPSFVTATLAALFALSLAGRRPTLFYLARDTTCPTAEQARLFEARWDDPGFRALMRRLTIIWATFLALEAALRCVVAFVWPDPNVIAATQLLWIILPVALTRWSIRAGRRLQSRSAARFNAAPQRGPRADPPAGAVRQGCSP